MTGSYSAAALLFLGLFLAGGAYSMFKNNVSKGMSVMLLICAVMAIAGGVMRW